MKKKLIGFYWLLGLMLLRGVIIPKQVVAADIEPLLVANFNSCNGINNLGGQIGPAFQPPNNHLDIEYVPEPGRGCVARLEYQIRDWGALWMKLPNPDLRPFRGNNGVLTFDIRAEQPIPYGVQIELKRLCVPNEGCGELSVYYMTGITDKWQRRSVPLEGFGSTGWAPPLSSWESVEEIVFTFAFPDAGNNGIAHLDNIQFNVEPIQASMDIPTQAQVTPTNMAAPVMLTPLVTLTPSVSSHTIYFGSQLAAGYGIGANSSSGQTDWVTDNNGHICMDYPGDQAWGVVFITVGSRIATSRPGQDLSEYTHISLELKGADGGEFLFIGIKDKMDPEDGSEYKEGISNLTTEWQTYTFPLSRFHTADLQQVYIPIEFVFESGTPAEMICFRNIFYTTLLPEVPAVTQITAVGTAPTADRDCQKAVPIFTTDLAPSNGILQLRTQSSDLTPRDEMPIHKTWEITAGQQIHNDIAFEVPTPRWASLWWQPNGADIWYLLPSQYWYNEGTMADLYGVACQPDDQPSYHTSFSAAIPEQLHPSFRNCPIIPILDGPAPNAMANTIAPLFKWHYGYEPRATEFNIDITTDGGFLTHRYSYSTGYPNAYRNDQWRLDTNLEIATTHYWRAFFVCDGLRGPYVVRSFTTGSGGIILPAPNLTSPAHQSTISPGTVWLHWNPVKGADEYSLYWREVSQNFHYLRWISGSSSSTYLGNLNPNSTYEWSIAARNGYGMGVRATGQFTTESGD